MKRRSTSKDSLDLLLDTICNAFGGLIFIALLVAIMAQVNHEEEAARMRMDADTLRKQLMLAEKTREELSKQRTELEKKTGESMARRILEHQRTLSAITSEEAKLKFMRESNTSRSEELARGVAHLAGDIMARLRAARLEKEQLLLDIQSKQQNIAEAEKNKIALAQEIQRENDKLNVSVSLPKEKGAGRGDWVIVRHGKIYPLHEDFTTWLRMVQINDENTAYWPIPGAGWELPADTEKFNRYLRSRPAGIMAMVYLDSFHVYQALRACVSESRVPWAWSPMPEDIPLILTTGNGTRPEQQ